MGFGNCILANDVPEHHEVIADTGVIFEKNDEADLTEKMQYLIDNPDIVEENGKKAVKRNGIIPEYVPKRIAPHNWAGIPHIVS